MSASGGGRRQAASPTKDGDEELAQLFLESVLGVPLRVHDKRAGRSAHGLEICYPGGMRGAAEVVSTRTARRWAQQPKPRARSGNYVVARRHPG